jgi:hypothetical protein
VKRRHGHGKEGDQSMPSRARAIIDGFLQINRSIFYSGVVVGRSIYLCGRSLSDVMNVFYRVVFLCLLVV